MEDMVRQSHSSAHDDNNFFCIGNKTCADTKGYTTLGIRCVHICIMRDAQECQKVSWPAPVRNHVGIKNQRDCQSD